MAQLLLSLLGQQAVQIQLWENVSFSIIWKLQQLPHELVY